jgi:hypothetical protein
MSEQLSVPRGFEYSEKEQITMVGDLVAAAQGVALVLRGIDQHLPDREWMTVVMGLSTALAAVANRVDAYVFQQGGICVASDAIPGVHLVYILEKQAAKLRQKE